MVYAKYITRTGKDGKQRTYGPYYYRSVRSSDGKIRNVYLGSKPVKKRQTRKQKMNLRQFRDALAGVFLQF